MKGFCERSIARRAAVLLAILAVQSFCCSAQTTTLDLENGDADELVHIVVALKDGSTVVAQMSATTPVTMSATTSTNTYLRSSGSGSSNKVVEQPPNGKYGGVITSQLKRTNAVAMTIPKSQLEALVSDPDVLYVRQDNLVYPMQSTTTTSTSATSTEIIGWGVIAVDADSDTTIPAAAAPASNQTAGSDSSCFKVCVVDGGLLLSHPDIPWKAGSPNVMGKEFNIPGGQTWDKPIYIHGTHTTGIMVATPNNDIGIKGVMGDASNICMLVARVFDDNGSGQLDSILLDAVEWCADNGARVINLSLGSDSSGSAYAKSVYDQIAAEGTLVFAAAGNSFDTTYNYPASFDSVIGVSAVDQNLNKADFSTFNDQVNLAAPGVLIRSTVPQSSVLSGSGTRYETNRMDYSPAHNAAITGTIINCGTAKSDYDCQGASGKICVVARGDVTFVEKAKVCEASGGIGVIIYNNVDGLFTGTLSSTGVVSIPVVGISKSDGASLLSGSTKATISMNDPGYTEISGTSMATPFVSGIATRIWSSRPQCTSDQVREALFNSAKSLSSGGGTANQDTLYFGRGLVQAQAAYDALLKMPSPCGTAESSGTPNNTKTAGQGGWKGGSSYWWMR